MRKNFISICIGSVLTGCFLAGCSNQPKEVSDFDGAKAEDTRQSDDKDKSSVVTIGFIQSGEASDWKTVMTASMNDTFREVNGYKLKLEDIGEEYDRQFSAVQKLVKEQVDYLVISSLAFSDTDQKQWNEVLTEAKQAEIPVIFVGEELQISDDTLYTAWVGSDYLQQGYDAAGCLEDYLKDTQRQEDTIEIVWAAEEESNVQETRMVGFCEWQELAGFHQWEFLQGQGKATSKNDLKILLQENSSVDVVICENDAVALDVMEMIEEAGYSCGEDGILLISFGGSKEGLSAVLDGKILADIENSPSYGPLVEEVVKRLEAGLEAEKKQYLTEEVFTAENAGEAIEKKKY